MGKLNWLSQNAKMRRSSEKFDIYNWGIPAFLSKNGFKTCPNAKNCVAGCYARSGTYRFSNVAKKYEERLQLALSKEFEATMTAELDEAKRKATKRGKTCLIRIHDSGDWFNLDYTLSWFRLIRLNSDIKFYTYTKQVEFFKDLVKNYPESVPDNLILIYSYGGKQDDQIDSEQDRHSKVFPDEASLLEAGYADASHDDTVALGDNPKIGLIYHGAKKYENTKWDKVS